MVHDLLGTSDKEYTAVTQALSKPSEYLILGFFGKVDQNVPANYEMISLLVRILEQVVFLELYP